MADAGVTIIKKKKSGGGEGHHGGAWKVAYADFVTAMMAFFLLMWLLNATSDDQRKGLAEFFDPKVPIAKISGGGSGAFGGDSVLSEETLTQTGRGAEKEEPSKSEQAKGATGIMEDEVAGEAEGEDADPLERIAEVFEGMRGESDVADKMLRHIRTRVTDEGLVIDLFDTEERPLFGRGQAEPTPTMQALLAMIGEVAAMLSNDVAIEGHTDAAPYRAVGYGNWELSSDRAHSVRRALVGAGLPPERVARVVGKADRELAVPGDPSAPRNRRIAVTILRSDR